MLISKFDLYNAEWLELVFENRNKEYGAYDLRQHYAGNMVRAMIIAFSGLTILFAAIILLTPHALPVKTNTGIVITMDPRIIPPPVKAETKTPQPTHPKPSKPVPPAPAVATVAHPEFVVTIDVHAVNPVKNENLTAAIAQTTTAGKPGGENVMPDPGVEGPSAPAIDNGKLFNTGELDIMPEPVGGMGAWAKFLNKNLRFPAAAQEDGLSGRVFLSFVIERDGTLSNIVVEKGAGHGFDEEAMRVLKLAKAWKPGMQNGQPVRVKYVIPINFQSSEQ